MSEVIPGSDGRRIIRNAAKGMLCLIAVQLLVVMTGIAKSFLLPKFWGVEAFAYWQIYFFYLGFAGLFPLGFNDGVYLRYGKYQYERLPFARMRSSLRFLAGMLAAFSVMICLLSLWEPDREKGFSFFAVGIGIWIMGMNGFFVYILQVTNQISKYGLFYLADKIILLAAVIGVILLDLKSFKIIVIADLIARSAVVLAMAVYCRRLVWGKAASAAIGFWEFKKNISAGISLMLAAFSGLVVMGLGRIVVEYWESLEEYAYYSWGMSFSALVMLFIGATSLVLYPVLKRLSKENYAKYFSIMNEGGMYFNALILFSYFPTCYLILLFLPKYEPVLAYLNLLFVVLVLQGKINFQNNTFFKILRCEKAMLRNNISAILVFIVFCLLFYPLFRNAWSLVLVLMLTLYFQCYAAEYFLDRTLKLKFSRYSQFEILLLIAFLIITSLCQSRYVSFLLYLGTVCLCLVMNFRNMMFFFKEKIRHFQ